MSEEIELKLEAAPGAADRLQHVPGLKGDWSSQRQVSVYFDTHDHDVRELGCSLRVRKAGRSYIQTVKSLDGGAGLFQRGEWEYQVEGPEPDRQRLENTPLARLGSAKLTPIVTSEVTRRKLQVHEDGALVEVVIDEGEMRAGKRKLAVNEVELEVIRGEAATVFAMARRIGAKEPVRLSVMSKAERGFALADGKLDQVVKAEPMVVRHEMVVADAFAAIVAACLRHFRLNEHITIEKRQPEALHQSRVAMRRLRSAMSLFRPAIADPDFPRLQEELRWFTRELGEARNLDVFLGLQMPAGERKRLEARRKAAYDRVVAAMESQPVRMLMLDLVDWSRFGVWRRHEQAEMPLPGFAGRRIDRLWHGIARARHLNDMDDKARHKLRIQAKKLRYALEFTAALYERAGNRQGRFARAVEALQEALGELNDAVAARSLFASDAWLMAPDQPVEHEQALLRGAEDALRDLRKIGPYWRDAG